ncbi:HNH endonuclease signature motif containing protein [Kribbella yunnanensis]
MEMLAMPPVYTQSSSELLSRLDTLKAAKALIETDELQVLARLDEMGAAAELGARDTVELVSERYRIDRAEVRKDLTFTSALRKYPAVTAALPDPSDPARPAVVSPEQAKVIVKTLEKAPATVPVETLTVAEEQMVEAARITNPRELTRFGHKVLSTLDTDGPEPAEDQARAKEYLRLRPTEDGVKISGFVAGAYAELLKTQLHTLSKPHKTVDGERDPRTADQRGADALKIILDRAAGNPDSPGVPHLTVTIDFEDLKASLAAAPAALGGTADTRAADGRGGVGELVFGGNLSAGAVRLLACDAAVLPIVLGGDSQPLDVGREQRFVNRYIRRALNKRDKGCVVCKAPPWMCHAHHLIHWAAGGPTSLQNLALLCAVHHRAVHDGQWALSITTDGVQVTRPSWADPPRTDPAALAEVIGWVTPVSRPDASDSDAGRGGVISATADWSGHGGVTSSPTHEQPDRLPPASTLPNPALAAAREALRTWLTAVAPNYTDPWGTNATPTAGP